MALPASTIWLMAAVTAASEIAAIASATTTSISVNPPLPRRRKGHLQLRSVKIVVRLVNLDLAVVEDTHVQGRVVRASDHLQVEW
jgi:hypothetical protein